VRRVGCSWRRLGRSFRCCGTCAIWRARAFLAGRERVVGDLALGALDVAVINNYLLGRSRRGSISSSKAVVTGLRSLLRFLYLEGLIDRDLAVAVAPVANWGWRRWSRRLTAPASRGCLTAAIETPQSAGATLRSTIDKLNRAGADVVNAYLHLELVKAWGDASTVAADGTQVDTLIDNLLAESHIRYGGYGGIAYHHVADNYIALFSHFIPCGVWEAVYIIEGLLKQQSDAEPDTIHADTQGQSYPVHALAHLFGFDLLPRIRNWKDLRFYRPAANARYLQFDSLFGQPGENTINWRLIQTHWADLMQIVLSIREGRLSSTLLLRRLGTESRKNNIYKAFRELGRVIRTITLLRFISEPELRQEITAATNTVEAYNAFSAWLRFGHDAIERNDPAEQEKIIKFNSLLADCVIFHTAVDMTAALRQLADEGWTIEPTALSALAVHHRAHQTLRRVRHRRPHDPARSVRSPPGPQRSRRRRGDRNRRPSRLRTTARAGQRGDSPTRHSPWARPDRGSTPRARAATSSTLP
jgi:TnpA family transposase